MKKLLIGLILSVAMSAPAFAGDHVISRQTCSELEETAVEVMNARQSGVPISKVMALLDNDLFHRIIIDAYDQHAMQTPENAMRQRTEFGVKWAVFCIKNR